MNVASPDCNGLPIYFGSNYTLEELLWPHENTGHPSRMRTHGTYTLQQVLWLFGGAHIDAILAELGKRGLEKDSATMDQELPALFRCDKNMKPKTGQFGIQFPDRFSL